jgi:hypothetical protein
MEEKDGEGESKESKRERRKMRRRDREQGQKGKKRTGGERTYFESFLRHFRQELRPSY